MTEDSNFGKTENALFVQCDQLRSAFAAINHFFINHGSAAHHVMPHLTALVEKQRDQCGDHADGEKEIERERFQTTSDDARHDGGLTKSDCAYATDGQMRLPRELPAKNASPTEK
mgnify:CR=1 FL=1